jgi:hypothetical protein
MAQKPLSRDNIPRLVIDAPSKYWLVPGLVIQWLIYMNPQRGFRGVAASTRHARSPLMTYVYSILFWGGLVFLILWLFARLVDKGT